MSKNDRYSFIRLIAGSKNRALARLEGLPLKLQIRIGRRILSK